MRSKKEHFHTPCATCFRKRKCNIFFACHKDGTSYICPCISCLVKAKCKNMCWVALDYKIIYNSTIISPDIFNILYNKNVALSKLKFRRVMGLYE